jgi:crossover junction endodeoxyribonuclease RusA
MIELPWPPPQLSPNKRLHWAALAKYKARYREECCAVTKAKPVTLPDGPLALRLTFFRPDRRSYDRDNLLARMKAGLDGMSDALGINDNRFTVITLRVSDIVVDGGVVHVYISQDNEKDLRSRS